MSEQLIVGAKELFLGRGEPVPNGAVWLRDGLVAFAGPDASLPSDARRAPTLDAKGGLVTPGLVDPHTHLVFAGDRAHELTLRCQGKTYLEIAQAGGGIVSTVKATRAASEDALVEGALPRLRALLAHGVTTAEVKSGYGLDVESELKMLRAIRRLQTLQPITLVPTVLPLHAVPPGVDRAAWVREVVEVLLPQVAQQKLAVFCDAFVEQSAYTADEARTVMRAAKSLGLTPRLHVDQLTPGAGAELAAELGASSADHLEHITDAGRKALAANGTVAVLAPVSNLFLRQKPSADGRALKAAGVTVALCTNCNPGSAMTENVALALSLACLENGLTPLEALEGFTSAAGQALRQPKLGTLEVGAPADVTVFGVPSVSHLPWHLAQSEVRQVIKGGEVVFEATRR